MKQIINIETSEIFTGTLDNELIGVAGYPYREATQDELDALAMANVKSQAYEAYSLALLELKSEDELNIFFQKIGVIDQTEYDTRLNTIVTDKDRLLSIYNEEVE